MPTLKYSALSIEQLEKELGTDCKLGLTNDQALSHLKTYGPNELSSGATTWFDVLLRQFKSAFVYLLLAEALISFVLGVKLDGALVLLFIVINAVLGFY